MSESKGVVRYSDAELAEFKEIIDNKLGMANEQLGSLMEQIWEVTENSGDEHGGDWMDDSSINSEVEMLNNMAIRQRKYIKDLENALIRIKNKTYGICIVTGELIDKRRLLAVPTTTKSVLAKNEEQKQVVDKNPAQSEKTPYVKKESTPKIITKVIKKSNPQKPTVKSADDDDDLVFDENFDLDIDDNAMPDIDFDSFADDEEEEDTSSIDPIEEEDDDDEEDY